MFILELGMNRQIQSPIRNVDKRLKLTFKYLITRKRDDSFVLMKNSQGCPR